MATTALAVSTIPDKFGYSTTGLNLTFTAADVVNGNHIDSSKPVAVVVRNVDASTTYTVSITSVADNSTGRTGSVASQNVAAGESRLFYLQSDGWLDPTSSTYLIQGNNADIEIAWYER